MDLTELVLLELNESKTHCISLLWIREILNHIPELVRICKLPGCLTRPSIPDWIALLLSFMGGVSLSISWILRSLWPDECAIFVFIKKNSSNGFLKNYTKKKNTRLVIQRKRLFPVYGFTKHNDFRDHMKNQWFWLHDY